MKTVVSVGTCALGALLIGCSGYGNLGDLATGGARNGDGDPTGGTGTTEGGASTGGASGGAHATGGSAQGGSSEGGTFSGDPFAPRSGPFKVLVYTKTTAFREPSIRNGEVLLAQISAEQSFELKVTGTNEDISAAGLAEYEVVVFLNTTGDVFKDEEEQAFETWMTTRDGAFIGVHRAAETEVNWDFYREVIGPRPDAHSIAGQLEQLVLEPAQLEFPALAGLPSPWPRSDEWFWPQSSQAWSEAPGVTILARKSSDGEPVIWAREWNRFRAFYTSIGHEAASYSQPDFRKHLTGAILWAARREHLLQ
jgi:type 1 glutamine amidotransferase